MKEASSGLRIAIASLGALHFAIFGWAAWTLPWKDWSLFSVVTGVVATGYFVVACMAALGRSELGSVWRAQAFLSLAWALAVGLWLLHSAWRLAALYGGLGEGVAAALIAVYAIALLFSVPFALWGIGWTGGVRLRPAAIAVSAIALLVFGWLAQERSRVLGTQLLSEPQSHAVSKSLRGVQASPLNFGPRSLFSDQPAQCDHPLRKGTATVLIAFRRSLGTDPSTAVETRCVQGAPDKVGAKVQTALDELHAEGRIKIDIVRSAAVLNPENVFETLMVQPGLNGMCWANRCFAPWQMVASAAFVTHTPFAPVPDARMGVSFASLQFLLEGDDTPPQRIETESLLIDGPEAHELTRVPSPDITLSAQSVAGAVARANKHIRRAQRPDGSFNYLLDPHTGEVTMGSLSIPRQAGTTLVLCELGDKESTLSARKALAAIAKHRRPIGSDAAVLNIEAPTTDRAVRVGSSALSLVAFLQCRNKVGKQHDKLIAELASALLKVQRPDGGFWHSLDADGEPGTERSLYIDGQIMFAFVLLEASEGIEGVDRQAVKHALNKGYAYFADAYWPAMLGDFFYLEENWHCLAARAALSVHRHDGYEQFCIDYAKMKARMLLGDDAPADFAGAFGFGIAVPPHNTATAGFGEAAAAALAIAKRRGDQESESVLRDALARSLTFLLRNQLGGPSCFACTDEPSVDGAFPEHMASPMIRIDYVQHAMAALGHGGRELGLLEDREGKS